MIKAEIGLKTSKIEAVGTIPELCSDITNMFRALLKNFDDNDVKEMFMKTFLAGFDSGVVFGVSKEDMDKMRKECDDATEFADVMKNHKQEVVDALLDLLNALKGDSDVSK